MKTGDTTMQSERQQSNGHEAVSATNSVEERVREVLARRAAKVRDVASPSTIAAALAAAGAAGLTPGELAEVVGLSAIRVRVHIRAMERAGEITSTETVRNGSGCARIWRLVAA